METANIKQVLQLFNRLSKSEQLELADKINIQTFEDRWHLIDTILPETKFSEEDIIKEVRAVRYGSGLAKIRFV